MSESKTPRTDAIIDKWRKDLVDVTYHDLMTDHARQLETELTEANRKLDLLELQVQVQIGINNSITTERDELVAANKRANAAIGNIANECSKFSAELAEAKKQQPINTSYRLFDLVRDARSYLHERDLISDEEYHWLCSSEMAMSPTGGSPSPRRLEEYDNVKASRDKWRKVAEEMASHVEPEEDCECSRCMNKERALLAFTALKEEAKP